jgi:hypothetical protein
MCAMGLLNTSLSDQEMKSLYLLHNSRSYSITEMTTSEQWQQQQQRMLEKV